MMESAAGEEMGWAVQATAEQVREVTTGVWSGGAVRSWGKERGKKKKQEYGWSQTELCWNEIKLFNFSNFSLSCI